MIKVVDQILKMYGQRISAQNAYLVTISVVFCYELFQFFVIYGQLRMHNVLQQAGYLLFAIPDAFRDYIAVSKYSFHD